MYLYVSVYVYVYVYVIMCMCMRMCLYVCMYLRGAHLDIITIHSLLFVIYACRNTVSNARLCQSLGFDSLRNTLQCTYIPCPTDMLPDCQ